MPISPIV